jgi:ribonuclease Z
VSARELVVLGTSSQAPTRRRNHNGYLLRWDGEGLLFDPGEGTQRQLLRAGVPVSAVTRLCLTHFHGDHCLGVPGVLQRRSLDGVPTPLHAYYPASGREFFARLRYASAYVEASEVVEHPVVQEGVVETTEGFRLVARRLDHRVETVGWRLEEPDGVRMLPELLAAHGVRGPDVGVLQREGSVRVAGGTVRLEEVSAPRPGQVFALVMDTRRCPAAVELARGADLLVCEATFLDRDADLAERYAHLTARAAAELAREAGVRRLVLTHLSQRYALPDEHLAEASAVFPDVVVAEDLDRIAVPPRAVADEPGGARPPERG